MSRIGLIGLGLLGSALAQRFRDAGLLVVGYDVDPGCRSSLVDRGGQAAASAADLADAVPVLVLSLPDSDVVADVIDALRDRLAGKLVIDTTTGDPDQTAALGERLAGEGVRYLDAAVAGSSSQTAQGEALVLVGGRPADLPDAESILRCFARRWFHLGPWGSGARAKLALNLVLGLNRAALAEGLAFAQRLGLDGRQFLDLLCAGPAYSRVMDAKGPRMLDGRFTPEARLRQHHKDVRLMLEAGRRAGAPLPLTALHERLLADLESRGFGDADNSAVIRAFDPPEAN